MKHDILFELGTEELPSALVKPLAKNCLDLVLQYLDEAELPYGEARYFASPRRIGFLIKDVVDRQDNHWVRLIFLNPCAGVKKHSILLDPCIGQF